MSDSVPEIRQMLASMRVLKRRLGKDAIKELQTDNQDNQARVNDPTDRFYNKPIEYALHVSEFYECSRCHNPFFGGYIDCQDEQYAEDMQGGGDDALDEEQLMCQNCRL